MREHRGFTLLELLVVVGVIALLCSIVIPALAETRRISKRTACLANLEQISIAIQSYLQANRNRFFYACEFPTTEWRMYQNGSTKDNKDPQLLPSLPMALRQEMGGGANRRWTDSGGWNSYESWNSYENKVFLCPADRITNHQMLNDQDIMSRGRRYFDSQKTSYEWWPYLNGVVYQMKTIRLLADLLPVKPKEAPLVSDYEDFHQNDSDPKEGGVSLRPKTMNILFADFQPRSDKGKTIGK